MMPPADEPIYDPIYEPLDELEQEVALVLAARERLHTNSLNTNSQDRDSRERFNADKNSLSTYSSNDKVPFSKSFRYVGTNERITLITIVVLGAIMVPLAWSQAHSLVLGLMAMLTHFFILAWAIVVAVLGWGLALYPVAGIIILSSLYGWVNRFSQADKIELRPDGIVVGWPSGLRKSLAWTDISSVFLFRPSNTMLPQKWLVGFGTGMTRPLSIRLPVASAVGATLVELLKSRCQWASIDPDLIEAWEPAIADSHTELWLKSLSKAPKESELMPLFPGAVLDDERYLILNRIGVGGQGTAYLAKDCRSGKEVVLKENLFPVYVDSEIRELAEKRFRQEVELLSQLNHDNVIRMLGSFVEEHRGYLILDYIDGTSLRQLVKKQGVMPEYEVTVLAIKMCEILAYLHDLSPPVVHRDFTPENLMLGKDQQLVLIDFNVARQLESTKTATVVGKHAFIPPEQFRGETDTRSDIYAFGATLYFLLTGVDPEPISQSYPSEVTASISAQMNALVAKSTAQEAADRFQSAQEILSELTLLADKSQVSYSDSDETHSDETSSDDELSVDKTPAVSLSQPSETNSEAPCTGKQSPKSDVQPSESNSEAQCTGKQAPISEAQPSESNSEAQCTSKQAPRPDEQPSETSSEAQCGGKQAPRPDVQPDATGSEDSLSSEKQASVASGG